MKPHPQRWLVLIPLLCLPIPDLNAAYLLPPSTGADVPYSIQTKTLLKRLFNNGRIAGGQVVALKDQPGRHFSGNYIDIGDLGGVKNGDVFALFSPKGDPVGLIRVTQVQRYVSAFEFIELTVDPSENLIAKRVTEEIKSRLPERLRIFPDMRKFKGKALASKGPRKGAASTAAPLPPLPGEGSSSALPPLPGEGTDTLPALPGESTGDLPPAPETDMAPMGSGLPPLPMGEEPLPAADGGLPPLPDGASDGGLPPMEGDSSLPPLDSTGGLPPADPGMSDLPPMPDSGMPALPGDGMADPGASSLPPMGDPSLPPMEGSPNGDLPPLPSSELPSDGSLPPVGMDDSLPPLSGASELPPMDNSLPPVPEAGISDPDALPPLSELPETPSPMAGFAPSAGMDLPPASMDGDLPPTMDDNSLAAPPALADLPSPDSGLPASDALPPPSLDSSLPPSDGDPLMAGMAPPDAGNDMALPPVADSSLPPVPDMGSSDLPPTDMAALPPEPAGLPPVEGMDGLAPPSLEDASSDLPPGMEQAGLPPSVDSSDLPGMEPMPPSFEASSADLAPAGSGHAAQLGLPALPTGVKGGFLQDLPTLAGG